MIRAAFPFLLLGSWALFSKLSAVPRYLLPPPWEVAHRLGELLADGRLLSATVRSLLRMVEGYGAAILVGVPAGILVARSTLARLWLKPLMTGLQALPSICWLPLALLWFGLSELAILFVVFMGSFLAVAIATENGILGIQPQLLHAAGTLGIRSFRFYSQVLIPAALPEIVTGLKLGWSFAWRALMAGELLFVAGGLGQLLTAGRELLDVAQVVAVMGTIVCIGMVIERAVFVPIEFRIRRRWGLLAA